MDGEVETVGVTAAKRLYPLLIGQTLAIVFTALVLITVARLLTPGPYGLYSFAFGYQAFIDGVSAWGIGIYLARELSTHSYKKDFDSIISTIMSGFALVIPLAIILTVIGVALSGYVANAWFPGVGVSQFSLQAVSLITFFIVLQGSTNQALIGLKKSSYYAFSSVLTDIMQLLFVIILLENGYGVNGAIIGMLLGLAIGTMISVYFLYIAISKYGKFRFEMPTRKGIMGAWNFSLPIAANNFLNNGMQNFGILLLGLFVATSMIGNYGAALKGLSLLALVYGTVSAVQIPTFSDVTQATKTEKLNNTYNKVILYSLLVTVPILVYITVFSAPGLYLMVSGAYATAPLFLSLIAIGSLLNLFGVYVGQLLISKGHTKAVLMYNLYSTVIEALALVVLVYIMPGDQLKVVGAIIASFFMGNIAMTFFFVRGAKRLFMIRFEYARMARLYTAGIILGILLLLWYVTSGFLAGAIGSIALAVLQLLVGAVLTAVLFPILLALMKVISKEDVQNIKKITKNMYGVGRVSELILEYASHFVRLEDVPSA
ncbi:MAG: oligosaccharide flippase family protein [Candidatus Micrarchaeota archaeon]|nr:oligosaccharide flippase family protein [Candidatus Micrarchaeota archaeon]